ncbi:MAG: 16S rRNA (adenine(1518)-N(6)/adenine(1519)-N(6))-dimethyltransferase RsmA [Candidatus Berkelbacteria bacterium]
MIDLTDKSQLLDYLKANNLWAKHGLGQNFLVNKEVLNSIVESADIDPDDLIIEVGPGLGTLTQELVAKAEKVIGIEKDEKLAGLLPGFIGNEKLDVVIGDILDVNIPELVKDQMYKVVANIPYYITSRIIRLFLELPSQPATIVMLVQKEVAERICAKPGEMSVLALSVQVYGKPEIIEIVKKESFFPAPAVDSAILRISYIEYQYPKIPEKDLFRTINIGFAAKRKTLVNNLQSDFHVEKIQAEAYIEEIGLKPSARAQELTLDNWAALTKVLNEHKKDL